MPCKNGHDKRIELELLSPARSLEYGKTAINAGADAVYIGAPKFGARKAAENSIADIETLCSYAHLFHAKVFVALNTILFENELEEAEKIIKQIYNAGADALIIQDMGILEMDLPPIELQASTQAHNYDVRRIKFLQDVGFSRVILARELSLKQIEVIKSQTNIKLEAFVHGALCVSFSGQCYMSAFMGHRSGNRGECAQPCRLKYEILDENEKIIKSNTHALSLRDMNRGEYLPDMIEAGITSFKIEGRLKDEGYVKNITTYYRKKIDDFIECNEKYKPSSIGKSQYNFIPNPCKTFNRGFTKYFLHGRDEKPLANTSKSVGERIGTVSRVGLNYIEINNSPQISNGDGLCWFDKTGELSGYAVQKAENNKILFNSPVKIETGDIIYRNFDAVFNKLLNNAHSISRKIHVELIFKEVENGFELSVYDSTHTFFLKKTYNLEKEVARNTEKAVENLKNQLGKGGSSIFYVDSVKTEWGSAYFFTLGELNNIRRDLFDAFEALIKSKHKVSGKKIYKTSEEYFENKADFEYNIANSYAVAFYKRHGLKQIDKAFELCNDNSEKNLMTTKMCLRYEYGGCPTYQKENTGINPKYLKINDFVFKIDYDCKNCVMKISKKQID